MQTIRHADTLKRPLAAACFGARAGGKASELQGRQHWWRA